MKKTVSTLKMLLTVVLLLALASPACAGEAETSSAAALERLVSTPAAATVFFFLPSDTMWSVFDDVSIANSEIQSLKNRLKPVGTRALFQHLETKVETGLLPNIVALKQLDKQAMFDWEIAVTRDLDAAAVAINFRF